MDNSAKNKVIAKNTLALYFRLILATGVALYTSRVVLEVLGVTDYGVYNIVGGVVVLLSFLQVALSNSVQRYLSYYASGKVFDVSEQTIYSSSFYTIALLAGLLFLFCETIGLWMVNNLLNIPPDKMFSANVVYQISIVSMIINLMRSPYDALIIAHERMSFFALASIIESVLKLGIILLLCYLPGNKLIMYALLVMCVAITMATIYHTYSRRKIDHLRPNFKKDVPTVRRLLGFTGWNTVGGAAQVAQQQGANVLLNLFYGVTLNATMGIANQVKMAAFLLTTNITLAANPQITKSYAAKDYAYMSSLIFNVSKYAFFLIFMVGCFLMLNMDFILNIWLVEIPPHATAFCILMLLLCMPDSCMSPLWTAAMAEGNIRNYQLVNSALQLLTLPLIYVMLYLGYSPWWTIGAQVVMQFATLIYRIAYVVNLGIFSVKDYLLKVILRVLPVVAIMSPICYVISLKFEGFTRGVVSAVVIVMLMPAVVYFIGISPSERKSVQEFITRKLKRS